MHIHVGKYDSVSQVTSNQINNHLVFFFISETFTGPMSTSKTGVHSKETTPTACDRENFPVHNQGPKQNSFTT